MTKRRPLNDLGLWLLPELNRRNIPQKAFARLLHTTPQNLTDLLRGRRFHGQTLSQWQARCQGVLDMLDRQSPDTAVPTGCRARYQAICSTVEDVTLGKYDTYGLQCLCHQSDTWVQIRVIRDISTYREPVLHLANQLNACHLSPLHFEEVVLDHIGR